MPKFVVMHNILELHDTQKKCTQIFPNYIKNDIVYFQYKSAKCT